MGEMKKATSDVNWWYIQKNFKLKEAISKKNLLDDKQGAVLCLSRELNVKGQRCFYLAEARKFCRLYHEWYKCNDKNMHFYEVITDKCVLYFDIEYDRQKYYMVNDSEAMRIFIRILIKYLTIKFDVQEKEIYYMTLKSSSNKKYSSHLIVRILSKGTEMMFRDNFCTLQNIVIEFQNYLLSYVFNASGYEGEKDEKYKRYMKVYCKNEPEVEQENMYCKYADEYFVNESQKYKEKLVEGLFVDWTVYTRNRCMRLMLSSKYEEPKRILVYSPSESRIPAWVESVEDQVRFSLITKAVLEEMDVFQCDYRSLSNQTMNLLENNTIQRFQSGEIVIGEWTTKKKSNLARCVLIIESLLCSIDNVRNYSVQEIKQLSGDIVCINVDLNYCLLKKAIHKKNRVYFVHDVNSSIIRHKCFSCGKRKFYDIIM